MITTIELAVVRIRAPDGRTVGAGFLVAERQVLTCAHVVAAALDLPEDTLETPQAEVHLDFPLVAPGSILTARAIHWQSESDVAGLELDGDPPTGTRPVRLVTAQDLWGHAFRAFGFPSGYDDGVWASGVLRGRQAAGWVQIEDVKEPGYWVQPGFSGTAVWDEQLNGVVGMAVAADTDRGIKAAFMIPANLLIEAWPQLGQRSLEAGSLEYLTVAPKPRSVTMSKPIRVFISSTWVDLQPEREAVEEALHRMQDTVFAGMEYFGSRPETPRDVSLAEVDRSDVYIGIFAHRYGSGITGAEYRRARERGLPCLIYLKDDDVPVPPAHIEREPEKTAKLEALKGELKAHHTVSFFKSPDHLATQVVADLHNFLGSAPSARQEEPSQRGPKYQISIADAQGVVIGDGAQVTQVFGQEPRPSVQAQPVPTSRDQRCADLAESIHETLELIKQYQDQRRLADDPKAKRRAEREIADLRSQLAVYQTEYRELGCE